MLQVRKLVKLEELVGANRGEEEEPEGEVVAGPSEEAVIYSSGNTPLFFFLINHFINYNILLHYWVKSHIESCFFLISWPILLTDESNEGGEVTAEMKWSRSWGLCRPGWRWELPSIGWGGGMGLLCEVFPLFNIFSVLACISYSPCI